jgi:hypothetical protein
MRQLSFDDWGEEGRFLFGNDILLWKFRCPSCGYVAAVKDWMAAGAPEGAIAFSCLGRYLKVDKDLEAVYEMATFKKKGGPCLYAGGGLIRLNPVQIIRKDGTVYMRVFEFDRPKTAVKGDQGCV